MTTRLILVGGFLGAGKTTLLWNAAHQLSRTGKRVGLITNDQAPELVDTALLSQNGLTVAEVNGSCFCCNFPGLVDAMSKARVEANADVLIAEPVGSCTDLSATIIQPLKEHLGRELVLSPLSVMADPARLNDILNGGTAGLHPSAAYIFRKQLEEADIIVISKSDLLPATELAALQTRVKNLFPAADVWALSAKTGAGLAEWVEAVMTRSDTGQHLADVDYDVYAEGEAVLGWLNATLALRAPTVDGRDLAERLLRGLGHRFDSTASAVGHVKLIVEDGHNYAVGNLTGAADTLSIRGAAVTGAEVRLTINARVQMPPETLESIVREQLAETAGSIEIEPLAWRCLSPGRPRPTYRYDRIVKIAE
jgi:Ni2+-binding GTPase involved in maturation of urease and hydrogenase